MLAAGWELAAHTIHHSDLTTLEGEALEEEVAGSRKILQHEFHVPANFCYTGATTEIPGYATRDHPYELARIEVLGSWTLSDLAASLQS